LFVNKCKERNFIDQVTHVYRSFVFFLFLASVSQGWFLGLKNTKNMLVCEFPKTFWLLLNIAEDVPVTSNIAKDSQRCSDDYWTIPGYVAVQSLSANLLAWYVGLTCDILVLFTGPFGANWIQFFMLMVNEQVVHNCESGMRNCRLVVWY